MDVAIVTPRLKIGGLEKVVLYICKEFSSTIFTFNYSPKETFEEFNEQKVVSKNIPKKLDLFFPFIAYPFSKFTGFDVVNPHANPSQWTSYRNDNVSWYCHSPEHFLYNPSLTNLDFPGSGIVRRCIRPIDQAAVKRIPSIMVNSDNVKKRVFSAYKREDPIIAHPPVEVRDFKVGKRGSYFLCVSRFNKRKRLEMAIEGFKKFCQYDEELKLIVTGSFDENIPSHKRYLSFLTSISKGFNVEFVLNPSDDKLKELYANSLAVIFTARDEDFGIVPLEAMASGKPVIAINEGGPKETVVPGETGFLFNSLEELVYFMHKVAKMKESDYKKISILARKHVSKNFNVKNFIKNVRVAFEKASKK